MPQLSGWTPGTAAAPGSGFRNPPESTFAGWWATALTVWATAQGNRLTGDATRPGPGDCPGDARRPGSGRRRRGRAGLPRWCPGSAGARLRLRPSDGRPDHRHLGRLDHRHAAAARCQGRGPRRVDREGPALRRRRRAAPDRRHAGPRAGPVPPAGAAAPAHAAAGAADGAAGPDPAVAVPATGGRDGPGGARAPRHRRAARRAAGAGAAGMAGAPAVDLCRAPARWSPGRLPPPWHATSADPSGVAASCAVPGYFTPFRID